MLLHSVSLWMSWLGSLSRHWPAAAGAGDLDCLTEVSTPQSPVVWASLDIAVASAGAACLCSIVSSTFAFAAFIGFNMLLRLFGRGPHGLCHLRPHSMIPRFAAFRSLLGSEDTAKMCERKGRQRFMSCSHSFLQECNRLLSQRLAFPFSTFGCILHTTNASEVCPRCSETADRLRAPMHHRRHRQPSATTHRLGSTIR